MPCSNTGMTTAPTPFNWFSILTLGLIWGGTFMVVSIALEGYGPITVACARTTLGAIALLSARAAMRRPMPNLGDARLWRYIAVIGALSTAFPFMLLSWGQQYVPSAFAGISMSAVPLMILPLAHFFTDERLSIRKFLGVCFGFVGALVLIGPGLMQLGQGAEPLAQIACLGAALCYALSSILTRRCPPVDPVSLSALSLTMGAIILVPSMLVFEGVPQWVNTRSGLAILFLGFLPTALATLLRVQVIRSAGSVFMTLVNYQVPLWSMVFGAMVLSEDLPLRFYAALALILSGLAVSQLAGITRWFLPRA